jgi:phage terminase small subunit
MSTEKPQHSTPKPLTAKQRAFVEAYLDCLNATEAARRAKYAHPNTQGPRLLVHVGIRAEIEAGFRERTLPKDEVLARLTAHARGDMGDFLRVDEEEITLSWSLLRPAVNDDGEVDVAGVSLDLAMRDQVKPTDLILKTETITRSVARLDLVAAGRAGKLHLVKKYSVDKDGRVSIELYDAQTALAKLGEYYKVFGNGRGADVLAHIDLTRLSPQQLERIVHGDDPFAVILGIE